MEVFQSQDPTLSCPKILLCMRTTPDLGEQPSSQSWRAVSKLKQALFSLGPDKLLPRQSTEEEQRWLQ